MYLKTLSLGDIHPYERNPRINDKAVEPVMKSIQKDGYRARIIVDKDGVIIAGHTRYEAMKRLGWTEAEVWIADDMTPEQIADYRIRDNLTADFAEWDFDELEAEIEEMDLDFDMSEFEGFEDIQGGVSDTSTAEEDNFDEDTPIESKAKLGDIYQLGQHRLMCGDSTDAGAWALLMDGEKADMVFTDPPYGVAIGDKNATLNSVQKAGRCCENIKGDTMTEEQLYDMLKTAFINVRENCADDAVYFVTSPQGGSLGLMMMMMKDAGLEVRHVLMWAKNSATFSLGRLDYDYQHEPIFYTWTKSHHNFRNGEYRTTIWEYDKPRKCDLHPTMKPVALVANAIMDGTKEGMIVLDAFGGSGTTIIAAEQLNRKARVMELDPHYVDVIIARWEKLTGEKAVLLNG
jgi:site-specific DNA-methyltransferase (adenine-specific)